MAEQSKSPHCYWRGVRAYDADDLEQWVEFAPAGIQAWLGRKLGVRPEGVVDFADYWASISTFTEFSLTPDVFVAGRTKVVDEIENWLSQEARQLALVAHSPVEVIDFFAATVAAMPSERRESVESITASLLLGGWKDEDADVEMFAKIAGRPYADCQVDIQRMASGRDSLLLHAANKWRLISKDFAWSLFEDRVSFAAIERFESLAIKILADDDPRFQLPEKERLYANIRGHIPKYSTTLKQHVAETLAFLGEYGDRSIVSSSININATVNRIVASVLSPTVTWHRWASLGSRLPLLAEASSSSFLRVVREDLKKSESELAKLLHEEGGTVLGRCNHSGLLWALESLAWPQDHVGEIVEFLLRLVQLDTGEKKWGNRPTGSTGGTGHWQMLPKMNILTQ